MGNDIARNEKGRYVKSQPGNPTGQNHRAPWRAAPSYRVVRMPAPVFRKFFRCSRYQTGNAFPCKGPGPCYRGSPNFLAPPRPSPRLLSIASVG
jgi:hypothetical protein